MKNPITQQLSYSVWLKVVNAQRLWIINTALLDKKISKVVHIYPIDFDLPNVVTVRRGNAKTKDNAVPKVLKRVLNFQGKHLQCGVNMDQWCILEIFTLPAKFKHIGVTVFKQIPDS